MSEPNMMTNYDADLARSVEDAQSDPLWEMIPDAATEDISILAEWWAGQGAELNRALFAIKRRVEQHVRDQTTVQTRFGVLKARSQGWEWDEAAIAHKFPELVTKETVTFTVDAIAKAERILSLVTEEVPDADFTVKHKANLVEAGNMVKAGGEKGERLAELRIQKPAKVELVQP